jgi:predicted PurR-regulated permease PerM
MRELKVSINPNVLLWAIGIIAVIALSIALIEVVVIFFLAFIVSAGFRPIVDKLEYRKVPRLLSLLGLYAVAFIFITFMFVLTIDTLIAQFNRVTTNLPEITENVLESLQGVFPEGWGVLDDQTIEDAVEEVSTLQAGDAQTLNDVFSYFTRNFQTFSNAGINLISSATNVLFSVFIVIMLAGYLIVRRDEVYSGLIDYVPKKHQEQVVSILDRVEKQLGEWLGAQIFLMIIIGILAYIALMIPSVVGIEGYELYKFALLLALIAGFTEAFPNVGPTVSILITMLLGFGIGESPAVLLYVFVAFASIQQLEAVLIVPQVMKKAIDLDPIIVILAIAAGLQLGGVIGAILSIPVIVILRIILEDMNENRKRIEYEKEKKELAKSGSENLPGLLSDNQPKPKGKERIKDLFRKFF